MHRRSLTAVTWNVDGFNPSESSEEKALEQAALIKSVVDDHCVVCLQELSGAEPASDLEESLRQRLGLDSSHYVISCNHEQARDPERRVALILNLGRLGLPASSAATLRSDCGFLDCYMDGSWCRDLFRFTGAVVQTAGRQLVVGSLDRPGRYGPDGLARTLQLLSSLISTLHEVYPRPAFLIGGSFNLDLSQSESAPAQALRQFASQWALQAVPPCIPSSPVGGSSPQLTCYFLASEDLAQPGSECSVLPGTEERSSRPPVSLTLRWPAFLTPQPAADTSAEAATSGAATTGPPAPASSSFTSAAVEVSGQVVTQTTRETVREFHNGQLSKETISEVIKQYPIDSYFGKPVKKASNKVRVPERMQCGERGMQTQI